MRLVNGTQADPSSGRLQLYIGDAWVDVVDQRTTGYFDHTAAAVVCKALGWIGDVATWDFDPIVKQQGPCVHPTREYRLACRVEAADLLDCNPSPFYNTQCNGDHGYYPVIVICSDSKGARAG